MADAEEVFREVSIECKGWSESGEKPQEKVAGGEEYIGAGGLHWYQELDVVSVPIPPLHFRKIKRGRLDANVKIFSGNFQDLEMIVPRDLTLWQVVSNVASVFDLRGLLAPVLAA